MVKFKTTKGPGCELSVILKSPEHIISASALSTLAVLLLLAAKVGRRQAIINDIDLKI